MKQIAAKNSISQLRPPAQRGGKAQLTTLKAAEFFAGIGLVRLALEGLGWEVVFANDFDAGKAEMYRHQWPGENHLSQEDIHDLNAADIPDCDLYTASFPCNNLSIAGRWEGLDGEASSAFWQLIRILKEKKKTGGLPSFVILENVLGFLMRNNGEDFKKALFALDELGYTVDAVVLNATHWVPQSRQRMFVIGRRDHAKTRRVLAEISDARPAALIKFIAANQDLSWDLRELPALPTSDTKFADIVEELEDDDKQWWSEKRTAYFMEQMNPLHAEKARAMIDGKKITYATAFRRVRNGVSRVELRTDGIAGCLRTPRGGSARQILFKAGKGRRQVRLLTARECARLQGVPDKYKISVKLNHALFGFGDAVCVPVYEWVVGHCLSPK